MNTSELLLAHMPDLLEGIRSQLVLDMLKDREELGFTVFSGFRVTPQSMRMPVVKQRLMREMDRDHTLLDAMSALWVESNQELWGRVALCAVKELDTHLGEFVREYGIGLIRIALILDDRQAVRSLLRKVDRVLTEAATPSEPKQGQPRVKKVSVDAASETLAADNKGLKHTVRELQHRIKDLERRLKESREKLEKEHAELKAVRHDLVEGKRQFEKTEKLADRHLRAKEAAEYECSVARRDLKRAERELRSLTSGKSKSASAPESPSVPSSRPIWTRVVSKMMREGSYEIAKVFCESLKELEPENLQAHLALEQIYSKMNDRERQIDECIWVALYMGRTGQPVRACAFACRALIVDPSQHRVQLQFKRVLESIDLSDETAIAGVRRLLARLKLSNQLAYRQAYKVLKRLGKTYANALEGPRETLHPDKVFGISDGKRSLQVSTRRIVEAVDRNEIGLINFVQHALPNMRRTKPTLYSSIMENLDKSDRSYISVITEQTSPVVVDGSNVAWHDSVTTPRLQNILDLRYELRSEGYFPIYVYVDASLQYQIDQPTALRQMIDSGAIIQVESRTDADETILARARTLQCQIVSNDRMTDWDPSGEISKVRFVIDTHGITIYGR